MSDWSYKGKQTLADPVKPEDIAKQIVEGCECQCCKWNRSFLGMMKKDTVEEDDGDVPFF